MTTTTAETSIDTVTLPATVLRDALAGALVAASTETYLTTLNSIQVEKTGATLVFRGTDRYRLVKVTVALDGAPRDDWEALLIVADVKQILAALPRKGVQVATLGPTDDGRFAVSVVAGASLTVTPLDGEYPKTDQLISTTTEPVDRMGFKPKQLADIAKIPGRRPNEAVQFRFNGEGKPIIAEWTDGVSQYLHLMMPVRFED